VVALATWQLVSSSPASGAVTGGIRVLLMVVDANQPVPRILRHYEGNQVTNVAWTDASTIQHFAFERSSSFANLFGEMSYGQVTITGDTLLMAFPYDASDRTWSQWVQLADTEAQNQGFDLSQYDRYLYILPYRPSDATTAGLSLGNVGWCAPYSYVELSCLFHELGHTIGFTHAAELLPDGTTNGIGDKSDGLMGIGFNCHANVVNKFQVGWLTGNRLQTFDTTGGASFNLAAQSNAADTLQALEIVNKGARPGVGVVDTFVSFRDTGGFDGQLTSSLPDLNGDQVSNAVLIHQRNRLQGGETLYLRALTAGETYDQHGVSVTVTDISGGEASVSVTRAAYDPQPHQAVLTPANIDSMPQQFEYYDVAITNTNDPALVSFDAYYDATFTPIGPGWVMGWASGFAKTVAPGQTRSFPLLVMSPSSATPGTYGFSVTVTELDGDAGPYSVQTSASYTVVGAAPDTTPPSAPTGLDGSSDGTSVSLSWNPSSDDVGVVGYEVLRESGTAVGNYTLLGTTIATSFNDFAVPQGVPHRYVVRAFDAAVNLSLESNVFAITVSDTLPPDAPTGLAAYGGALAVRLYWIPATDNVAVAGYDVLRDGTVIASIPEPHFRDASVSADTTYTYAVRAFDAEGNTGSESSPLIVTTQYQSACGLGTELVFILPALIWLRRGAVARRR
jgi:hypothetical protein